MNTAGVVMTSQEGFVRSERSCGKVRVGLDKAGEGTLRMEYGILQVRGGHTGWQEV